MKERSLSCVEVASAVLSCIEEHDGELNAFVTVLPEQVLEDAWRAEKEILGGEYRGSLHGVPVGLKDLIYTRGLRTAMGSAFFKDFFPEYDATFVRRLKEAGA
jgi:aspartyl-tRNA(Asn)/glutamyl-tRNA(Gln) amidotransferase subunit A